MMEGQVRVCGCMQKDRTVCVKLDNIIIPKTWLGISGACKKGGGVDWYTSPSSEIQKTYISIERICVIRGTF